MKCFKVNPNGTTTEIKVEGPLKEILKSEECYIIVSDEYRKVYLWKGVNSNVRSKFIGAKRSQDIRGQVGMHYGVVPLDEGDEDPIFIKLIGRRTKNSFAPRDFKKLEESFASDAKETDLKKCFRLFSNQPGIPGTLYSIQVGKINGKWASRLLKGESVIASYVYKKNELGKSGFPKYKNIVGWVLKTIALPEIDPLQITNAIKALTTYSVDNKTLQRLRDENRYHLNEKHRSDDDDDRFPYPYIFKPPKPPDDLARTPQVQVHAPPKDENPDDETYCQFCGLKLTKHEQFNHSCKIKPE